MVARSRQQLLAESHAGQSPSVNIPILPVVPEPNKTQGLSSHMRRWAIALVSQLDILFEQIKSSLIGLDGRVDLRATWQDPYTGQEVPALTMVEDDGWLMVSNKQTSARAAPVVHGPPESMFNDAPAFVTATNTSLVETRQTVVLTTGALCQEFRVWVPTIGPTVDHYFIIKITNGELGIPYTRSYYNPLLVPNQWTILALADVPLPLGSEIEMSMQTVNKASTSPEGPFDYNYGGAGANKDPAPGEWTRKSNNRLISIHVLDANGVDRELNLLNAIPGSIITIAGQETPSDEWQYFALNSPVEDPSGDFYTLEVDRIASSGGFSVGDLCAVSGVVPIAGVASYSEILNYYPSGDPSWGEPFGSLFYDGVEQTGNENTGYGLDMAVAPGEVSVDWDYMNYANLSDAAGQEGTRGYSGRNHRENNLHIIEGTIQTTDNSWVEVLRVDVFASHKGIIRASALRSDQNDAFDIKLDYMVLLNGTLTIRDTQAFKHSTVGGIRARIDSSATFLIVEVQGNSNQTWDWIAKILKRPILS